MKKYLPMLRLDNWIKQVFIIPGIIFALILVPECPRIIDLIKNAIIGVFAISIVASSNYIINEWLDAPFDKYHPIKKNRSAVVNQLNVKKVYLLYFSLFIIGITLGLLISRLFSLTMLWLWIMGILYNVKPFRLKEIPYIDVITESTNSAIRLIAGWFIVSDQYLPPISIVLGFWFAGAFMMATKRLAEYNMINDPNIAALYRKSFQNYSKKTLIVSSLFYAMLSVLFVGIFLIKYRIELILFIPFFIGLFCYYFSLSFKENSLADQPEKLYKNKCLVLYILVLSLVFLATMTIDIPALHNLLSEILIQIH